MKFGIFFLALIVAGCSASNHVSLIASSDTVVKYSEKEGYQDRFVNLYSDIKTYPVTCQEDCYPAHIDILCDSLMQDCQYQGDNPQVTLDTGFNIKWLGHASFIIQTATKQNILIDPVFGQFDWPINWGFKVTEGFYRNIPDEPDDVVMQATDAVLYSHVHYDHFNKSDIETIGNTPTYFVPLGVAKQFDQNNYRINEMAWYAKKVIGETTIHFVPAHHFSSRTIVPFLYEDNNAALWGGWVLETQGKTLFFAGDTGYSPHFKSIAERFGNIDVCLLPIASYFSENDPKWYREVHTTPEDALTAAKDLGCRVVVPWGYGNRSWRMGDKTSHSALFRLLHMNDKLNNDIPLYLLNEDEEVMF